MNWAGENGFFDIFGPGFDGVWAIVGGVVGAGAWFSIFSFFSQPNRLVKRVSGGVGVEGAWSQFESEDNWVFWNLRLESILIYFCQLKKEGTFLIGLAVNV